MKRKVLTIFLGVILILGVFSTQVHATSTKKNGISEEEVQAIVDQKVQSAVSSAVTQMQAEQNAQNNSNEDKEKENKSNGIGMVAAAIATGLGCIGAGIAVAVVASSAVGAISENPSLLGKTIIFAGLAEGIAIYGLIIAIMILNKV